jgi:3'(2'), 5'-bisphosphate nucleotidase
VRATETETTTEMTSATDRARLLEEMVTLVQAAHVEIMQVYARPFETQLKADQSPLTEADLASHRVLTAGLERLVPRLPIVSEEGGLPDAAERATWPAYWLIDPLDGTKEFLAKNGEFTVNLALIEHSRPTLGVVGVPARDQVFVGDVVSGIARKRDANGDHALRTRRYSGSAPTIVASRRHGGEQLEGALKRIEQSEGVPELRNVGSALKLCLLAEGEADLYPRLAPTSEWDTAAAQAVLEAAGGAVLQLDGDPVTYNKDNILNPEFVAVADPDANWLRYFSGR